MMLGQPRRTVGGASASAPPEQVRARLARALMRACLLALAYVGGSAEGRGSTLNLAKDFRLAEQHEMPRSSSAD